ISLHPFCLQHRSKKRTVARGYIDCQRFASRVARNQTIASASAQLKNRSRLAIKTTQKHIPVVSASCKFFYLFTRWLPTMVIIIPAVLFILVYYALTISPLSYKPERLYRNPDVHTVLAFGA